MAKPSTFLFIAYTIQRWLSIYQDWILKITYIVSGWNNRPFEWNLFFYNCGVCTLFVVFDFKRQMILNFCTMPQGFKECDREEILLTIARALAIRGKRRPDKVYMYPIPCPTPISKSQLELSRELKKEFIDMGIECQDVPYHLERKGTLSTSHLSALGVLASYMHNCRCSMISSKSCKDVQVAERLMREFAKRFNQGILPPSKHSSVKISAFLARSLLRFALFYVLFTLLFPSLPMPVRLVGSLPIGVLLGWCHFVFYSKWFAVRHHCIYLLSFIFPKFRRKEKCYSYRCVRGEGIVIGDIENYPAFLKKRV